MDSKTLLQIVGIALGLLYLWLEYRADIRLWIVGLIMPIVHAALYFKAGLYADCSMQAYYVLAGLYGLAVWLRSAGRHTRTAEQDNDTSPQRPTAKKMTRGIAHVPAKMILPLLAVGVAVQAAIYTILVWFTDSSVPFWDSLTTAMSVVAMWMLSRKYIEQWGVWLVVDVITATLYIYKGIPLTAGLYVLYALLAAFGYARWRKIYRNMAR